MRRGRLVPGLVVQQKASEGLPSVPRLRRGGPPGDAVVRRDGGTHRRSHLVHVATDGPRIRHTADVCACCLRPELHSVLRRQGYGLRPQGLLSPCRVILDEVAVLFVLFCGTKMMMSLLCFLSSFFCLFFVVSEPPSWVFGALYCSVSFTARCLRHVLWFDCSHKKPVS